MPWWSSCLDRGALMNVDAPGCGTLVVRGPTGTSRKVFILGYSCTQRFPRQKCLLLVMNKVTLPRPNQRGHPGIKVNPRCTKEGA